MRPNIPRRAHTDVLWQVDGAVDDPVHSRDDEEDDGGRKAVTLLHCLPDEP